MTRPEAPRKIRLLHDTLAASAARLPSKVALITEAEQVTYEELLTRSMSVAARLRELGVARGDRVAVYLENSVEAALGIYGALLAGAAFVVINPQTKADKLAYVLADCAAKATVTGGRQTATVLSLAADGGLPDLAAVLVAGKDGGGAKAARASETGARGTGARDGQRAGRRAGRRAEQGAERTDREDDQPGGDASPRLTVAPLEGPDGAHGGATRVAADPTQAGVTQAAPVIPLDLAALVYTSGSTGNPKGVMLSHQNMVFALGSLTEYLRLSEDDVIIDVLPLAFDYGLYQLLMAVELGATVVLERTFAFPAAFVNRVNEVGATVVPGVPTIFATLLSLHRNSPIAMPTVRRYTNTGAHLPDEYVPGLLEMSPGALVYKMYGLTECKRVCYLEPERVLDKPLSVGKAIPGTETLVLDDDGNEVPPGVTGTLYVRGPHVMMGYWNLPDATAHMLVSGPYPGERMLCTHDQFRRDEEGFLYFVGRSDDIIKSRGEKVSPVEVENALSAVPGVREVAVVGVPDDILGEAVRAFVVRDDGSALDERSLKREAMARLEGFMVPRDVVFMDELPKTPSGKVRKKSLREQGA